MHLFIPDGSLSRIDVEEDLVIRQQTEDRLVKRRRQKEFGGKELLAQRLKFEILETIL